MARRKKSKRPAAAKWSKDERDAWLEFLQGDRMLPPGARSLQSVIKQLRGFRGKGKEAGPDRYPYFDIMPDDVRHAASVASLEAISGRPHTRASQLREQSEAICRIAAGDVAFMVEKPISEAARPDKSTLFEDLTATPVRNAIFDLPDEVLHAAIITTRNAIIDEFDRRHKRRMGDRSG